MPCLTIFKLCAVAALFSCGADKLFAADEAAGTAEALIDVWPKLPPGETAEPGEDQVEMTKGDRPIKLIKNTGKVTLTMFRPAKDKDTGAAVVICPGGGYSVLAWDLEGEEVAHWLNSIGVTGIVLKYRVPARPGVPRYQPPLQDLQRAVSLVREKSADWGIDPQRIGILEFSAGGNLSAVAATNFDKRAYKPIDDTDKVSCRPDFVVLVYPAWLAKEDKDELVPEIPVTEKTPPVFFAHAGDDPITVDGSVLMYLALRRAKVPSELHVYASGGHGFGLRPSDQPCATWPARCAEWMKSQGWLTKK